MASKKPPNKNTVFGRDEMSNGRATKLRNRASVALPSPTTGSFNAIPVESLTPDSEQTRDEIRRRERDSTKVMSNQRVPRATSGESDTFVRQKQREAEAGLPESSGVEAEFPDELESQDPTWTDAEVAEVVDPDAVTPVSLDDEN
jgi:hypothetical protein